MKKLILISTILFLTQTNLVKGQCIAEAGPDIVVCSDWNGLDTIQIGGNPTASGGTPPYTYIWETSWTIGSSTYTASYFLNDTTASNPSIVNSGENLTFYLTVIDSESNICTDSVHVYFTNFIATLGYVNYTIQQGDSIYLTGWENVSGGFPPFQYLWKPNCGLTDSTSLSFWAKPDTSVAYYLTLTDSSGCTVVGAPAYFVYVTPLSIDPLDKKEAKITISPNPSKDQIIINVNGNNLDTKIFEFYDNKGQLIYTMETKEKTVQLKTKLLTKGINFFKITASGKLIGQGKFIVE